MLERAPGRGALPEAQPFNDPRSLRSCGAYTPRMDAIRSSIFSGSSCPVLGVTLAAAFNAKLNPLLGRRNTRTLTMLFADSRLTITAHLPLNENPTVALIEACTLRPTSPFNPANFASRTQLKSYPYET